MSVYHLRRWEVEPVLAGAQRALLRPARRIPCRHAAFGERILIFDRQHLLADTRCVLRAPVLIDAEGIRTVLPLEHDAKDLRASADATLWRNRFHWGAAHTVGQPDWRCLAYTLRFVMGLGDPPWLLELVGWDASAVTPAARAA